MIYHVYQPTVLGEKRWGYYYRVDGRKKSRRQGSSNAQVACQEDVESWIRELREGEIGGKITIREIAEHLFDGDGEWARRQARRRDGKPLARNTLYEHAMIVRKHIIPKLGDEAIVDVDSNTIEDFLYSLEISNKTRRNVATTLLAVLKQAQRKRIIKSIPPIEMPQKKSRKPNILTLEDLRELFPGIERPCGRSGRLARKGGGSLPRPVLPSQPALRRCFLGAPPPGGSSRGPSSFTATRGSSW